MPEIVNLIVTLLGGAPDIHEAVARHRRRLDWAWRAKKLSVNERGQAEDSLYDDTLHAILLYDAEHGKLPATWPALLEFTANLSNTGETLGLDESIRLELEDIKAYELTPATDVDVAINAFIKEARQQFHFHGLSRSRKICMGSVEIDKRVFEGPNGAQDYLRLWWTKDLLDDAPAPAGMWHENTSTVEQALENLLNPTEENASRRILTGFPHIDDTVVIGKKNNKFIGIVGMSNDGKSTVLHTMVYNMARDGANVLYVSMEHSPEELWIKLAFLHGSYFRDKWYLPSFDDWQLQSVARKNAVGSLPVKPEDQEHMREVLQDAHLRLGVKGLIDCQRFFSWEDIVTHLSTNQARNHYDVLAVDYLTHLSVPGDDRFRDLAIKKIIHEAQILTQRFDEGRGLVIVTPIQVNREGNKLARRAEAGESRYDLNAIGTFSEFQHDLDFCVSVYSDDAMKLDNELIMETLKLRDGRRPPTEILRVDPRTKQVTPKMGTPQQQARQEQTIPVEALEPKPPVEAAIQLDDSPDTGISASALMELLNSREEA